MDLVSSASIFPSFPSFSEFSIGPFPIWRKRRTRRTKPLLLFTALVLIAFSSLLPTGNSTALVLGYFSQPPIKSPSKQTHFKPGWRTNIRSPVIKCRMMLETKKKELQLREKEQEIRQMESETQLLTAEAGIMCIDLDKLAPHIQNYYIGMQKRIMERRGFEPSSDN